SRDTIYRWIRNGELERDLDTEPVRYKRRPPVPHKLDPYKPMILARLAAYPKLSAIRLFEEVRAAGYTGGYTRLKDYVREVRPRPLPEPVVRFETPPAQQAQVDFAQVRLPWGVRYGLLVVLGYSRLLWVRFYARQDSSWAWRRRSASSAACRERSSSTYAVPQLEWTPGRGYVEPLRGGGEWGNFAGAPMGAGCSRPPSRRSRSTASSGARLRFRGLRVSWTSAPPSCASGSGSSSRGRTRP